MSHLKRIRAHAKKFPSIIADCISDNAFDQQTRRFCNRLLQEPRLNSKLNTKDRANVASVALNSNLDMGLRIEAAGVALHKSQSLPSDTYKKLKQLALSQMYTKYYHRLGRHMLPYFSGDRDIESALLRDIEARSDKNPAIYSLGRMKCKRALPVLGKLLKSNEDETFAKPRVYEAIGDVGGEESFDLLWDELQREKNLTRKHLLMWALGATGSSRAKSYLLSLLDREDKLHFYAALKGLKRLGDKSTIPKLQELLASETDEDSRFLIRRTISAIEAGDTSPAWQDNHGADTQ